MTESIIFLIGLLVFVAAFMIFIFFKKSNTAANINILVSLVTMTSYAVLFASIGIFKIDYGTYAYPTRWLFYMASCGLLMYEVSLIMKKSKMDTIMMIALNAVVMLTGYFASITFGNYKWTFFIISVIAFVMLLFMILEKQKKEDVFVNQVRWYVILTWSLFPVVWILAPTGFMVFGAFATAICYLLLDITTKIIFGVMTARQEARQKK
jgi:sensory rhodopsin